MNNKKEDFFGAAILTGEIYFNVKSENREEAKNVVFDDLKNKIKDINIVLKDGTTLDISKIDWKLTYNIQRKSDLK